MADVLEEEFDSAFRTNVSGPLFLNKALLHLMSTQSQGAAAQQGPGQANAQLQEPRILHLGTGLAHGPSAQLGSITYSVTKAACECNMPVTTQRIADATQEHGAAHNPRHYNTVWSDPQKMCHARSVLRQSINQSIKRKATRTYLQ